MTSSVMQFYLSSPLYPDLYFFFLLHLFQNCTHLLREVETGHPSTAAIGRVGTLWELNRSDVTTGVTEADPP